MYGLNSAGQTSSGCSQGLFVQIQTAVEHMPNINTTHCSPTGVALFLYTIMIQYRIIQGVVVNVQNKQPPSFGGQENKCLAL